MADSCSGCGNSFSAFEREAAVQCAKCGRGPYCSACGVIHAGNCSGLPAAPRAGVCHACRQPFTLEDDFVHQYGKYWCLKCHRHSEPVTKEPAGEKWKPPELDEGPDSCFVCGTTLVAAENGGWTCLKCSPPKATKVGGNYGAIDIDKWFGLRKPTEDEAALMDAVRAVYISVAKGVLEFCPSNPDRTTAIRQLKESMQTAISSIVCADAWQQP